MMRNDYDIKFLQQENRALRLEIAELADSQRRMAEANSVLSNLVREAWERLNLISETLWPGIMEREAEANRAMGVKPGDMPNSKGDHPQTGE